MTQTRKHKTLHSATGVSTEKLTFLGEKKNKSVQISVIDYDQEYYEEKGIIDVRECYDYADKETVSWINIDGIHDQHIVKTLGMFFKLHPLLIEDITQVNHYPKADFYENNIFAVLKMLSYNQAEKSIESEQISFVLGENYILSFQEGKEGDVFESIRDQLRNKPKGKLRNSGVAYLFYLLLDTIVNNYFKVLEHIIDNLEEIEEEIIQQDSNRNPTKDLYELKRQLITVRKAVRPVRDIMGQLLREEAKFMSNTMFYLRDLYERSSQLNENIESNIDVSTNLLELYLSLIGNKTNEVMKILTIFSSIFLPLTFIAGVYGMNFDMMPELKMKYGYFATWVVMFIVAGIAIVYFKLKKWL